MLLLNALKKPHSVVMSTFICCCMYVPLYIVAHIMLSGSLPVFKKFSICWCMNVPAWLATAPFACHVSLSRAASTALLLHFFILQYIASNSLKNLLITVLTGVIVPIPFTV